MGGCEDNHTLHINLVDFHGVYKTCTFRPGGDNLSSFVFSKYLETEY